MLQHAAADPGLMLTVYCFPAVILYFTFCMLCRPVFHLPFSTPPTTPFSQSDGPRHNKETTEPHPCESNAFVRATAGVVTATLGTVSYFAFYEYPPLVRVGVVSATLGTVSYFAFYEYPPLVRATVGVPSNFLDFRGVLARRASFFFHSPPMPVFAPPHKTIWSTFLQCLRIAPS